MSANLCCAADQRSGSPSPELPNARLSDSTPARCPLLPSKGNSYGSGFTSAQSEDLHKPRQTFESAATIEYSLDSLARPGRRARTSSSPHNLQKIRSVQALIKKKLSRDLSKSRSTLQAKGPASHTTGNENDQGTVIKISRQGLDTDVKVTKEDLRNDLLSHKKPEEGSYEPDAEVLDDIVQRLERKTPVKRTNIYNIEWNASSQNCNDGTPGSRILRDSRDVMGVNQSLFKSLFGSSENTPCRPRMPQYSSSPNIRSGDKTKARRLRHSHSAASIEAPTTPVLQPIRLPSISLVDATPWSLSMAESLRLSAFPLLPGHPVAQEVERNSQSLDGQRMNITDNLQFETSCKENQHSDQMTEKVKNADISNTTAQSLIENADAGGKEDLTKYMKSKEYPGLQSSSASIHLCNMRISQHLRSVSMMSSTPSCHSPQSSQHGRACSSISCGSKNLPRAGHNRQTSSSGFASTRIPIAWGQVIRAGSQDQLNFERQDGTSSVYSSRPRSLGDSISEPTTNLSWAINQTEIAMNTTVDITDNTLAFTQEHSIPIKPRPSNGSSESDSSLNCDHPKSSPKSHLLEPPAAISVNSSTSSLRKVSKFKKEFNPSPPRKKGKKRKPGLRFLRPRSDLQSESEACFFDELTDNREAPHERKPSHSLISLKAEQTTLEHNRHDASLMWEKVLKAYQEEGSIMCLSPSKALAARGSSFRERSSSVNRLRAPSTPSNVDPLEMSEPSPGESLTQWESPNPFAPSSMDLKAQPHSKNNSAPSVEAWSRHPSHTRELRTGSASHEDNVKSRDFTFKVNSAQIIDHENDQMRTPTNKKKRATLSGISKSSSMTFSKNFFKDYTKLFHSQSAEFRRHGHGHRSSIAMGGLLDYPELEVLPEVWHRGTAEAEEAVEMAESSARDHDTSVEPTNAIDCASIKRTRNSDSAERQALSVDGTADVFSPAASVQVWSHFYESCVDYPRSISTDSDAFALGVGESKGFLPQSETSKSLPARLKRIKNESVVSVFSERSEENSGFGQVAAAGGTERGKEC